MKCNSLNMYVLVIIMFLAFSISCPNSFAQGSSDNQTTDEEVNDANTRDIMNQIHDLGQKMDENAKRLDVLENSINKANTENTSAVETNDDTNASDDTSTANETNTIDDTNATVQETPVQTATQQIAPAPEAVPSQPIADQKLQVQNSPQTDQAVSGPFDPISTRIISDPLYLPLKGQFYGSTEYEFSKHTYSQDNYLGEEFDSVKGDDNSFSQLLEYGLTNDLDISFEDTYEYNRTYVAGDEFKATGFSNPQFGTTYRVLDQEQYPVDVDLTADYEPDAVSAKSASNDETGTAASGRQQLNLEGDIGREMKNFTIRGYVEAVYLGKEKYKELSDGSDGEYKGYWEYTYGFNTQTRLTDRFSVNLGASYTARNNSNYTTSSGLSGIFVPSNYWDFNTSLNYQIIPDRLVGRLLYTYEDLSNSKYLYWPYYGYNLEDEKHSEDIFGLELSYLFN